MRRELLNQLRGMDKEDLIKRKRELLKELMILNMQLKKNKQAPEKGQNIKNIRKNIARISTIHGKN